MKHEETAARLLYYRVMVEAETIVRYLKAGDLKQAGRVAYRLLVLLKTWKEKTK